MKNNTKLYLTLIIIVAVVLGSITVVMFKSPADTNNIDDGEAIFVTSHALDVMNIGSYDGPYMEDGSDVKVSNVMMIQVKNNGDKAVQYAEITLKGEETALFKLSTLEPGQSVIVLEANKQEFNKNAGYNSAESNNVAFFNKELNTYKDKIEIQPLDGGLNIKNISKKDIDGEILIYFKDKNQDMLIGGITYRGRIEDGLKSGEIRQIMSDNFTKSNTEVMFITIDGE